MANNNKEAKITFKAETAEFTSGIKNMNSSIGTLNKQLSLNATQLKANGDSVELLQDKQKLLQDKLEASSQKIDYTRECLEKAKEIYGENSEEVKKWTDKLITAENQNAKIQNTLSQTNSKLQELENATKQAESALGKLESTISEQENELNQLKREYQNVCLEQGQTSQEAQDLAQRIQSLSSELKENKNALKDVEQAADGLDNSFNDVGNAADGAGDGFTTAKGALAEFAGNVMSEAINKIGELLSMLWELPEATEEYRTMMAKLEGSTKQNGYAVDETKELYKDLYGYLADDMAVTNCITNTQKLGLSQKQTEAIVGSSIAVWTAYGDSIPIEGLTESITETIQVGKVTGNLADALNWAGISEDDFNEKLAKCNSEQERAQLIIDTLNGSYGESKNQYDELTKAQRDYNEAQLETMDRQAELAEAILPVKTAWENLKGVLIDALTPAIETVCGWIEQAIDWFNSLPEGTQNTIKTMALVAAAIVGVVVAIGTILGVIGALSAAWGVITAGAGIVAGAIGAISLPVVAVIAAIVALIAAGVWLYNNWDLIKEKAGQVWDWIKEKINSFCEWCSNTFNSIVEFFSGIWDGVVEAASSAWDWYKQYLSNTWNAILSIATTVWNGIKTVITNAINKVKSIITTVWNAIKSITSSVWNSIKSVITTVWNNIRTTIQNAINKVKSIAQTGFNAVKTYIINPIKSAYSTVKTIFTNIYNTIKDKINRAKNAVKSAIDKMKGFFNFTWKLPSIKLPHFSVSGSKNPIDWLTQGVPKFSVKWYAQGGIMTQPTIFGGGEAGDEAILPLDNFYNYLDDKLDSLARNTMIDYDRMTDCFISALSTLTVSMSAKEVGRLTSKYSEQEINSRTNRLNRLGGDTIV